MVIDLTREMMAINVISQLACVVVELNSIVKIYKYKRFHEGHHFISMAMKVHDTLGCDMDHFIKECARIFHDRQLRCNLLLFSCIQFFKQCVNIAFQCALTFIIKRKIVLVGDVCSRFFITIRSHNLHVGDIKGVVGEITSYHGKDYLFPFFQAMHFLVFL